MFAAPEHLHGIGAETFQMTAKSQPRAVDVPECNFAVDIPFPADQLQVESFHLEQFCYGDRFGKFQSRPRVGYFFLIGLINP